MKRYFFELTTVCVLYTIAILVRGFADLDAMPRWLALSILTAPVIFSILIVPVVLRLVYTMDEVQQRIVQESCLVAMVIVGLGSFSYELVREGLGWPEVSLIWVWPALMGVTGLSQAFVRLRYR